MSTPWLTVASHFAELGEREVPGPRSNEDIIEMYRLCGQPQHSDEVAWCAAFVGACLSLSGYKNTGKLLARSYSNFGDDLHRVPKTGAIVVFPRGGPGQGHVGFVHHVDGPHVYVLGGNQSDMVKISRYAKADIIASRWPVETAPLQHSSLKSILELNPAEAPPHLRWGPALPPQGEALVDFDGAVKASDELAEGAVGGAVETLQRALLSNGFNPGEIDGEFGPKTRNAVFQFQMSQGLPATGEADARTLALLNIPTQQPIAISIGARTDEQRRADLEQLAARFNGTLMQLVDLLEKREAVRPQAPVEAPDALSRILVEALGSKASGQAGAANVNSQQILKTALEAALGARVGATPKPDAAVPTIPLSPIDKALGGEALVGLKTPLAVVAYAALSIFQSLGVAGPITATATQPPSTTSQILLTLIGAFGALGGVSKADRLVRALSIIATKR